MSDNRYKNSTAVLSVLLPALAAFLIILSLLAGSVDIGPGEVFRALFGNEEGLNTDIILRIRLPRSLASFVLGGALALSGYLMQTYFRNPIAGPFVLGVSSGAKLFVALVMVIAAGHRIGSVSMIVAAFMGALLSMGLVLLMAGILRSMSMLMVAGIMIGYICSAVTDFIVTFAGDNDIVSLHGWSKGSFSGISWDEVKVMVFPVFICFILIMLLSKPISAYLMGEDYAVSLGVNVLYLRVFLILLASLLAACVTAFAGPVSFVGIAVPQIIKRLLGNVRPAENIPAVFLGGGIFCLVCDLIARCAFAPAELSISTVTAVFGAPVVIAVLISRRKRHGL